MCRNCHTKAHFTTWYTPFRAERATNSNTERVPFFVTVLATRTATSLPPSQRSQRKNTLFAQSPAVRARYRDLLASGFPS
jgi:hypothetical protein